MGMAPGATETGVFSENSIAKNPFVKFSVLKPLGFLFTGTSSFDFSISNSMIFFQNEGVNNAGTGKQTFDLAQSNFIFLNNSHADSALSGRVIYQLSGNSTASFRDQSSADNAVFECTSESSIEFLNNASAGESSIHLSHAKNKLKFSQNATGGSATIHANQGEVLFADTSHAQTACINVSNRIKFSQNSYGGFATIHANQGEIIFEDTSDAQLAILNVSNGGQLKFLDSASGNSASVNLSTNSSLSIHQNNRLGSLNADASSSIQLGDYALQVGSNNTNHAMQGQIYGTGSSQYIKVGSGILSLTGDNSSFAGNTIVNEGILALNNQLGGSLAVNQSGVLSGYGTAVNNVTINSGGVIFPGNGIGALHVNGNYVQNPGSEYRLQINQIGQSGLLKVGGIAALNEASVNILPNGFLMHAPYLILQADGGIAGTFNQVTFPFLYFKPLLSYDPYHVILTITPNFVTAAQTENQLQVAQQIDSINLFTADNAAIFSSLLLIPEGDPTSHILDLVSGEQYTNLILADQRSTQRFLRRLYNSVRNISINQDCAALCYNEYKAWADIGGGKSFQKGENKAKGYEMSDFNVTMGIQRSLNDWLTECNWMRRLVPCSWLTGWTVGVAATYEHDQFDFNLGGEATMHNTQGALYALLTGPWYYSLTDFVIGYNTGKLERSIKFGEIDYRAHSSPNIFQASVYSELGLNNLCFYEVAIQPFVGIETGHYSQSDVKENGAHSLDLKISRKSANLTTSSLGVHLINVNESYFNWALAVDLAWKHLFNFRQDCKERFVHFGKDFEIQGPEIGHNGIEGALFISKLINNYIQVYVELSGERWKNYSNVDVIAGLSANF